MCVGGSFTTLHPRPLFSYSQERDHAYEGCIPDEIGVEQASQTLFLLTKEHTKLSVEQSTWLFLQNY